MPNSSLKAELIAAFTRSDDLNIEPHKTSIIRCCTLAARAKTPLAWWEAEQWVTHAEIKAIAEWLQSEGLSVQVSGRLIQISGWAQE